MASLIGRLISDRYVIDSLLASGGMASVYLAEDTRLERKVALKIIHPHLAHDKSFIEKFRREAKIAAQLSHPNLVNVFDQGTDEEVTYLIMEYVPGITLRDAMKDFGALDAERALEILEPLVAGLAAAHKAGILHRDIKPENVFLSDNGSIKLGDFGLARAISANTDTGSVVGTVAYLSPELVLRGIADARSDIYSLGVMLFEMLTGSQPYQGEQAVQVAYQHANDNIPAPSASNPKVPELMDEIVLWTTARSPEHRPSNAVELLPVISRARTDLARGLTSNLQDIAKTVRLEIGDFKDASKTQNLSFNTQVLGETSLLEYDPRSDNAIKLQNKNKRGLWLVALLTLLAIFGSAGAGWWISSGPGGLGTIPELVGRDLDSATIALEALDLEIEILEETSGLVPIGRVTRTEPESGTLVAKGSSVSIFISLGPKQIKIPNVVGLSLTDASSKLIELGLIPGEIKYFFFDIPSGQVFGLSSAAGSVVNQDTIVDINVSLGEIPNVKGLSESEALVILEEKEIKISETIQIFDNEIPESVVIRLIPNRNPLPKNGSVVLEISKGKEIVVMPEVVGETISAAVRLLESLGFKVTVDTNQLRSTWGIVKVRRQDPAANTEQRLGDSVTIYSR